MARNVKFEIRRGGGSSLEVLYGKVSLTPTNLHTLSSTAVLPAPTTFDLVNGTALATNVAPTPAPVGGTIAWAYKVKITDNFGKSWEYLVGVPDGTTEINFNVLPRYSETRPPAFGEGPAGPAGQSATIAIGTTTSGPTPAVTNTGTSTEAVLNFTLAKGDKGDTGAGVPVGGTALQVVRKNAANTTTEWATVDKALVGLGNADNTSDSNKPVSTPQKTYIDNSNTLAYRANTATSVPSLYPEGVTVFNVHAVTDGWPVLFGTLAQVRTERARANTAALQTITGIGATTSSDLASSRVMFRKSGTDDVWGDWQELLTTSSLQSRSIVNVRDFGAVGDGIADDSSAFNSAITYARDTFGQGGADIVAGPPGNFNLGSQVRVFSNITIDLNWSTIRRTASSGYVAFCTASGGTKGYGSGAQNIAFKRIKFRGDFASGRSLNNVLHHAENVLFEDCLFTEAVTSGHAIDLLGCRGVRLSRCVFEGRYEVEGRAYVEAVQLDHSTRSGAGAELIESEASWDGLPTVDVTMVDCESRPLTIGATTYLAPRLIGSHSRVADLRHKNVTIRDCSITDSGTTENDSNYRGWIHFTHTEGVLIDGLTCVSTRNELVHVLGFGSVATTYPLSSVAESSPTLTTASGPIACRDITIKNVRVVGVGQSASTIPLLIAGQNGATVDNVYANIFAKDLHSGDYMERDAGGTVAEVNWGHNVKLDIEAERVRRVLQVANSRHVQLNNSLARQVAHTIVWANGVRDLNISGGQWFEVTCATYLQGVVGLVLTGNYAESNEVTSVPYISMHSINGCTNVLTTSNNNVKSVTGVLVNGMYFYNTTTKGSSSNNQFSGFGTDVSVHANSAVTVQGTISFP